MKTAIQPVTVFPSTANTLSIRGVGPVDDTGRPNYLYQLQDADLTTLTSGNVAMTVSQWDNWGKTPTDEEYQLNCISTNLGLTRVK